MTTLLGFNRIRTVTVIPETANGLAEAFAFDIVTDMTESSPGQAYRHALQNGQEGITDGTRLEPEEFDVQGTVSDTPIRFFSPTSQGSVAAYEALKAIRRRQVPVTVITSWAGTLLSRWPETITGSHGTGDGASIRISTKFIRFRLVFTQLLPAQVDSDVLLTGSQTVTAVQH